MSRVFKRDVPDVISAGMVDHAVGQLVRLLGTAVAAALLVVCLGVFLVRWVFFRRPLDIRRA